MLNIYTKYPEDMVKRIMNQSGSELEPTFAGFLNNYIHLSKMIPKHFTILDCGCYLAAQCWYFRNHKQYIGIDLTELERFSVENTIHYIGDASRWIEENHSNLPKATFVISNYVPMRKVEETIRKYFSHVFLFYPE